MQPRPRHTATYPHTDQHGTVLWEVLRYEPKTFRLRRPDPDRPGHWLWHLGALARPL